MKRLILILYGLIFTLPLGMHAASLNGFSLDRSIIPTTEILPGGPGKDGIPAILNPTFISASQATYLKSHDPILGLSLNGQHRAYPIKIMDWHEVVNDKVNGHHFVISYCPLCGSGMAFNATLSSRNLTFGVSGLLYNSDVLLYDHQTQSLWSQIRGQAITGASAGQRLTQIPLTLTQWQRWQAMHPETLVLSTDTGFRRNYQQNPYADYQRSPQLFFPVANKAPSTYSTKETVMGFKGKDRVIAFPFSELYKYGKAQFTYSFEGKEITVHFDKKSQSAWVTDKEGKQVSSTLLYWFAWYAFYPDTLLYKAPTE
ncbi:DUF3179 domain-containing protein [Photobacterium makurazakiensis]|uniref:DUF3179 domain-containing protein n=1 Tax=Photobacterium makurazakiensis TaxID=2910234 RepID=UPI003D0AD124